MAAPIPDYTVKSGPEGFVLHRNGVPMKTPGENIFAVPFKLLADALADEWRKQKPMPDPASMPMTQLAATTIDITRKQRKAIVEQVASFAHSDLLCHRADQPEDLVKQQQKLWQPVLDWCAGHFDAVLRVGEGIMPIQQLEEGVGALRRAIESLNDFELTGLKQAAEVSNSLLLGLALLKRHLTADQVFDAAECDALFQMKKWGEDPAALKRHESIRQDLSACERFFELIR